MPEPVSISPNQLNPGLDYGLLREEGIALIRAMAGKVWTDHNESDPGITALEQLCYALTELSYRAEFPVKDLLINKPRGTIDPHRQALFIPKSIFPCNPLTIDDYRKLIVDRIPQVYNAWLTPVPVDQDSKEKVASSKQRQNHVNGLYDISVYVPTPDWFRKDTDHLAYKRPVEEEVQKLYCANRNLCEDLREVHVLHKRHTVLSGEILINDEESPEQILAGVLFSVGNFLAPQLKRRPLSELVMGEDPPDEIFDGPLMENGFIDDAQLKPKKQKVTVQEIADVIVSCTGVRSASDVQVTVDGGGLPHKIIDTEILELNPSAIHGIRLKFQGVQYQPNRFLVEREVRKLWRTYRATYELEQQYDEYFGFPQGEFRRTKRYYSVQNQFPNVYGIGDYGLPDNSSAARRGQAKQFKGYLLPFEQLMANYFAQLANVNELYSIEPASKTYFSQSLAQSVPNVELLLKPRYVKELEEIVASQDPFIDRRNRFLNFLMALYAEQLDTSSIAIASGPDASPRDADLKLIEAKQQLLDYLVYSTHNRGRAFDYLADKDSKHSLQPLQDVDRNRGIDCNIAGMLVKSRIQLGMRVFETVANSKKRDERSQVYVVENTLLRPRGRKGNAVAHPDRYEYSFTITTAVFTAQPQDENWIRFVENVIRQNTPAHIVVDLRFFSLDDKYQFELDYQNWHDALKSQSARKINKTSAVLKRFFAKSIDAQDVPPVDGRMPREMDLSMPNDGQNVTEQPSNGGDDLTKIEGIGPAIAKHLNAAGISSFSQLATTTPERIQEILDGLHGYRTHDPTTWPVQSQLAAGGEWERLQEWQDQLDGGRPSAEAPSPIDVNDFDAETPANDDEESGANEKGVTPLINNAASRVDAESDNGGNEQAESKGSSEDTRTRPPDLRNLVLHMPFNGDIDNHAQNWLEPETSGNFSESFGVEEKIRSKVFDGSVQGIRVRGIGDFLTNDEMTLEFWIKLSNWNTSPVSSIVSIGNLWELRTKDKTWKLEVTSPADNSHRVLIQGTRVQPEQWNHVALVYQGRPGELNLYQGGEEVGKANTGVKVDLELARSFVVGSLYPKQTFSGRVSDLRILNVALTPPELAARANPK